MHGRVVTHPVPSCNKAWENTGRVVGLHPACDFLEVTIVYVNDVMLLIYVTIA